MESPRDFEELCRAEYVNAVRTAYLITCDREEAVDLAQETFARAYQHWDAVSRLDRPGAWTQRVVTNLALSWRRRQRRRLQPASGVVDPPQEPDDELLAALRELPRAQRAVIVLRYYADQSVEEVARTLGKRPGTVRALAAQGRERLRRILGPERTAVER